MKKFSRFAAAVSATAVLASGAVLAPAASALDLKVEGETCTITESYEGEAEDVLQFLKDAADDSVAELKKKLPGHTGDIDLALDLTASAENREAAQARIIAAAEAEGFGEYEVTYLLFIVQSANLSELGYEVYENEESSFSRTEAREALPSLVEEREKLANNTVDMPSGTTTSSAPAIQVYSPLKGAYLKLIDLEIGVYQSCADGKDGTFRLDTSGSGIGGGAVKLSSGSSL